MHTTFRGEEYHRAVHATSAAYLNEAPGMLFTQQQQQENITAVVNDDTLRH
jgi:hypothetical protein